MHSSFTCSFSQYTPGALQVQLDEPVGPSRIPKIVWADRFTKVEERYFESDAGQRRTLVFQEMWTSRKVAVVWLKFEKEPPLKRVKGADFTLYLVESPLLQGRPFSCGSRKFNVVVQEKMSLWRYIRRASQWIEEGSTSSSIQFTFKAKPFPRWSDVLTAVLKLLKLK